MNLYPSQGYLSISYRASVGLFFVLVLIEMCQTEYGGSRMAPASGLPRYNEYGSSAPMAPPPPPTNQIVYSGSAQMPPAPSPKNYGGSAPMAPATPAQSRSDFQPIPAGQSFTGPAKSANSNVLMQVSTSVIDPRTVDKEKIGFGGITHPATPGQVIHLFPRYGYLSLSMRVVPRNDSQNWVFLEPSREVFDWSTVRIEEQNFLPTDKNLPLHNEFHIDLCEDVQQLIQAYYRRFTIEGLEKPWHAFAGGWRSPSLGKYFGIDPAYVKGDYRYMLVRVLNVRSTGRLMPYSNVTAVPAFLKIVKAFRANDYTSSFTFFNEVGTHYVSSYLTGNSIFQVFVYDQQGYDAVKRRLSETGWVRSSYMAQLPYLLPLWVKHMGKVMILNATPQTTLNIREALTIRFLFSVYPNIFKMHDNAELVRRVEKHLKNEPDGLLGLELKTLSLIFKDQTQKSWFKDSLAQTLQLWEVNL